VPWIELIVFAAYLLLGPGAWILFVFALIQTDRRMNVVKRPHEPLPPNPPRVSILIPAKDEGEAIGRCIAAALGQDYPDFNVIAIDDRSEDQTGRVLDEYAARDSRLTVVHIPRGGLPKGWTGKCHALSQGLQRADGQYLLFVDSDVVLAPNAVSATVPVAMRKQYGLLSLMPRLQCNSFWEGLLVPLAASALTTTCAAPLNNNGKLAGTAFANGQFMLIRRDAYEKAGGHAAVKDKFCEDIVMARIFKRLELRPRISWGIDLCTVRMYGSFEQIIRGWSRIFFASTVGSPWRSLAAIAFLLLCCFSTVPAFAWGVYRHFHPIAWLLGWEWIIAALAHTLLMTIQVGIIYRWTRNSAAYAAALPLAATILAWILLRSIWMCMTKKVEWRGTQYR
jgi:chlorobactene glucosyltransferase